MENRLVQVLKDAKRENRKLFCAYVTLGFPTRSVTETLLPALEKAGADILELGFPFSDPLADGPTIQFASDQALRRGVKLEHAFQLMQRLRDKGLQMPALFFSYLNPIIHYGVVQIAERLAKSGFDGLIVPDLPPDEGRAWEAAFKRVGLSLVYLAAPTTRRERLREIVKRSSGFVYYVSLRGVTGARKVLAPDLLQKIKRIKQESDKPVLVGFGVSDPGQARTIARAADGIIVGSAIVNLLRKYKRPVPHVVSLVERLIGAMK